MYSWCVCLVFVLIFGGLIAQDLSAKTMGSRVSLKGTWREGLRSISSEIPISIFIEGHILSVNSVSQHSDITISISKGKVVLCEKTFPASETNLITIDLNDFDLGTYTIEFRNQWGDYLQGEFQIL